MNFPMQFPDQSKSLTNSELRVYLANALKIPVQEQITNRYEATVLGMIETFLWDLDLCNLFYLMEASTAVGDYISDLVQAERHAEVHPDQYTALAEMIGHECATISLLRAGLFKRADLKGGFIWSTAPRGLFCYKSHPIEFTGLEFTGQRFKSVRLAK